ncbi:MAG: elongation factor P [Bacteroidales bacterium]|nr:elongation factor P [Bacteroidales bacterium]
MATTADFKNGLYLDFEGKPCSIVWFQHVKPGKGPAFVKSKLRNLENGRILEKTWNAGEKIDVITVEHREYQFLYAEEDVFNFMNTETFDQIPIPKYLVENSDLMKEGQVVQMVFHVDGDDEKCLTCELPTYVELRVTYTEPAVKGDTASTNALKEATLETGAKIMVPLFIQTDELIRVNTTDRSYGERVK